MAKDILSYGAAKNLQTTSISDIIELSEIEKKELDEAWQEIMVDAKRLVKDYVNNPSDASGSVIEVHEDSPFLDNNKDWKKEKIKSLVLQHL